MGIIYTGHPITCLCKYRGAVHISLQSNRNPELEGGAGKYHALVALPLGMARHPLHMSLDGLDGMNISTSPGFDTGTLQPVASLYTDCVIPNAIIYK
jgi:hypothetical protein